MVSVNINIAPNYYYLRKILIWAEAHRVVYNNEDCEQKLYFVYNIFKWMSIPKITWLLSS